VYLVGVDWNAHISVVVYIVGWDGMIRVFIKID
jgi:hypothetical protein